MWERWYEAIMEEEKLQSNKDITEQCIDFCEATTSKVHAVLQHAPSDLRGGTFLQHPRVLVATVRHQENPHLCQQQLHAAMFQVLRVLAVTESQETEGFLDEIQQQPSVFVLSGPATVISDVATASAFLADGWSTESVSSVVRTARTRQENHEKERAEHAYYSHMHDEATICDTFPATVQGLDEGEHAAENTMPEDDQEDETEHSLSASLQTRRQISRIHENMGHPSNRTLARVLRLGGAKRRFILAAVKHSCGACDAQKRLDGPIVSCSPNSFVFNDVVGLDLFFLKHQRKAHPTCHEHRVLVYWMAACCSSSRPVGRNPEERTQKQLVAVIRKASHPCRRPATQLVLWHICGDGRKRWNTTGSDTPGSTMEEW